jgi:glutamine amidotransferase-like uncharacterized protein
MAVYSSIESCISNFRNLYIQAHVTPFKKPALIKILRGDHFSEDSSRALENMMRRLFSEVEIQCVSEEKLQFKDVSADRRTLLILPGARTIRTWNFSEAQEREMQSLCTQGIVKIFAVCAGFFYSAQDVLYQYEEGGQFIPRDFHPKFCLLKGTAIGPAFEGNIPVEGKVNMRVEPIQCCESQLHVVVNGGGYYEPSSEEEGKHEVLATYAAHGKIAVIACTPNQNGTFNAVLSGPHFEYDDTNTPFPELKKRKPERVSEFDCMQEQLGQDLIGRLNAVRFFLSKMGFK